MAEHNDLLGGYHLQFLDSVVRTRESLKNTYIHDKCYKVHVYAVRLYFGKKMVLVMTIRYLYRV